MSPLPSDAELAEYYQRYDVLGEHEPYYAKMWGPEALAEPEGRDTEARFAWMKSVAGKTGKTLDVGSGPGLFLRLVSEDGGEAVGTELNARAAARSAEETGARVTSGTIDGVADRDFDVITLWDLLEHVPNPVRLVAACRERLKAGGWLFIETPDEASLLDRAVLALARLGLRGPADTFYGLHHLVLFRRKTVKRLLGENGFRVVEIRRATTDPGRVFRGSSLKDKMARLGLGLIGRGNKMLVAARKK
jgi:2-polyprenyl-3-methyl-5-hydroxy-6-metoxy-1,4-benzoquinol methylase